MEQWKVDLLKSAVRSPNHNPPIKYLRVKMHDGTWETINPPFLIYAKNRNKVDEIGRIEVEIKAYDGSLYNFAQFGTWWNVLNKLGREIELYEGWGDWVERTFKGYIANYKSSEDGATYPIVKVTALNELEYTKHVETLGNDFPEGTPLDKVGGDILNDADFSNNFNIDEYETKPEPIPEVEKWKNFSRIPTEIDYNAVGFATSQNGKVAYIKAINSIIFYGNDGYIKVYDCTYNQFRTTTYGFDKVKHNGGSDTLLYGNSSTKFVNGGYLIPHKNEEKLFILGKLDMTTEVVWGDDPDIYSYRINATMFNFKKRQMTVYEMIDPPFTDVENNSTDYSDARVESACWGVDGNLYYISITNKLFKGLVDNVAKTITWELIINLEELEIVQADNVFLGEILQFNSGQIHLWYVDQNSQYHLKVIGIGSKEVLEDTVPEGIVESGFYRAYDIENKYIVTVHNALNTKYSVYNIETNMLFEVDIENPQEGISEQYNYRKMTVATGDILYLVPLASTVDTVDEEGNQDQIHLIWTHKVRTMQDIGEPPQEIRYPVPANIPVFNAVKDVAEDSGMNFFADNGTGDYKLNYPKIKETPDFIFEVNVDVLEVEFNMNKEAYDNVRIQYGVGSNSGVIQLGKGNNKYVRVSPKINRAQAYTLAEIMYNPEYKHSCKFKCRGIPNFGVDKTIHLVDQYGFTQFKGVTTQSESENGQDGYNASYEAVGYILHSN